MNETRTTIIPREPADTPVILLAEADVLFADPSSLSGFGSWPGKPGATVYVARWQAESLVQLRLARWPGRPAEIAS